MDNKHYSNGYGSRHRLPRGTQRHRMLKAVTLSVVLIFILGIFIGTTVAFVIAQSSEIENVILPGNVSCEVTESFQNGVKSNAAVKNTGNTDAYIRAAINITWMKNEDSSNQTVTAKVPQEGTDYTIEFASDSGWFRGTGGYWYYHLPVAPGKCTGYLIEECRLSETAAVPPGYHLSVEIIASSLQSSPTSVAADMWNVTIDGDEIISAGGSEVAEQ